MNVNINTDSTSIPTTPATDANINNIVLKTSLTIATPTLGHGYRRCQKR